MKMKNKLLATAVMLVISIIMMSTASFAWFTISTAPEVTGLNATLATNDNLEIALATNDNKAPIASAAGQSGTQTTWGNIVDLANDTTFQTFVAGLEILPATLDTTLKAPVYGNDGRVKTVTEAVSCENTTTTGYGKLVDTNSKVYGYYVDVWVRTNQANAKLVLAAANEERVEGDSDTTGLGSVVTVEEAVTTGLEDMVHVAVQQLATATTDEASVTVNSATGTIIGTTNTDGALALTETNGISLAQNTATLLRVYVYIEGASITNAQASITGAELEACVNLQFALKGATMAPADVNVPAAATT